MWCSGLTAVICLVLPIKVDHRNAHFSLYLCCIQSPWPCLSLSIPPKSWVVAVVATHVCEILCCCPFPAKSDKFQQVLSLNLGASDVSLPPALFLQSGEPIWTSLLFPELFPFLLFFQSQCLRERRASKVQERREGGANQRRGRERVQVQKKRYTTPPPSLAPSKPSGWVCSLPTEEPAWGSGHQSRWGRPGCWWMSTTTVSLQLQGGPTFQSAPSRTEPGSWSRPRQKGRTWLPSLDTCLGVSLCQDYSPLQKKMSWQHTWWSWLTQGLASHLKNSGAQSTNGLNCWESQ